MIRNAPLDADGHPFPTIYWLTCPDAVKAVSPLESEGWIARLNERIDDDEAFAAAVGGARTRPTRAERGADLPRGARRWGGVGGTRTGVKCLHAHYAYHLAGGDDPVGRVGRRARRARPLREAPRGRVAAIDQGTNSIRLLVVRAGRGRRGARPSWRATW